MDVGGSGAIIDQFIASGPVARFIFHIIGATGTPHSTAAGVACGRAFGLALTFRRKITLRADLVRGRLAPERTEMAGDQRLVKAVLADQIDVLPV
jgi:hypothetical protein